MLRKCALYSIVLLLMLTLSYGCSTSGNSKMLKASQTDLNHKNSTSQNSLKYPSVNNLNTEEYASKNINLTIKSLKKEIHFKFNSATIENIDEYGINEDSKNILNNIASFMANHPSMKIRIEGNCDERGTEEYNLALGQKRAESAKGYLISKGITPNRIETISYGESQPVDFGHNNLAWSKNRRDYFVFYK